MLLTILIHAQCSIDCRSRQWFYKTFSGFAPLAHIPILFGYNNNNNKETPFQPVTILGHFLHSRIPSLK